MKTKVMTIKSDDVKSEWDKDEIGFIDGYIFRDNFQEYYAFVIIGEQIKAIPIKYLKVIK